MEYIRSKTSLCEGRESSDVKDRHSLPLEVSRYPTASVGETYLPFTGRKCLSATANFHHSALSYLIFHPKNLGKSLLRKGAGTCSHMDVLRS